MLGEDLWCPCSLLGVPSNSVRGIYPSSLASLAWDKIHVRVYGEMARSKGRERVSKVKRKKNNNTKLYLFILPGPQRRKRRAGTQGEVTGPRWGAGCPAWFWGRCPCAVDRVSALTVVSRAKEGRTEPALWDPLGPGGHPGASRSCLA